MAVLNFRYAPGAARRVLSRLVLPDPTARGLAFRPDEVDRAAARAVDAPVGVYRADVQPPPPAHPPRRLDARDALALQLRDLLPLAEAARRETTAAVDLRLTDADARRGLNS